jgi:RNA polymerase sigma factor (sigma-70 family)
LPHPSLYPQQARKRPPYADHQRFAAGLRHGPEEWPVEAVRIPRLEPIPLERDNGPSDTSSVSARSLDPRISHYAPIFDDDADLAATWVAFKFDHVEEAKGELILTYTPLVRYVVSRLNVTLPPSLERGDLVGFGTIGLIDAIGRFDIDRGLTFQTYAVTRIRGTILDELRSLDWVPRAVRGKMHSIDKATAEFEQQHGAEPDIDDLVDETGLDREDVRSTLSAYRNGFLASLDERMGFDSGTSVAPHSSSTRPRSFPRRSTTTRRARSS